MKNSAATYGHKSLVLNSHLPGNPPVLDRTLVQNHIGVDRLVIRPQYRDLKEPLHLAQGGTAGRVHKGMLSMQAQGRILVPNATQAASMEDQEKALRLAFDPYECYRDSPSTDGVYPLSWLEPTLNTTNYPTGWMPVTRYVRPVAQPETEWAMTDQSYRQWSVGLVAPDPRLYETPTVYAPVTNSNFETGTLAGWSSVLTGTGSAAITSTRTRTGLYAAQIAGGSSGSAELRSSWFATQAGENIGLSVWAFGSSSPVLNFGIVCFDSGMSQIGIAYGSGTIAGAGWGPFITACMMPAGTAFGKVFVSTVTAAGSYIDVDDVVLERGGVSVMAYNPATVVNRGTVRGPLRVTLAMDGVGDSNFTIFNQGTNFILDLSTAGNHDAVQVVMETCGPFGAGKTIKTSGVDTFDMKTSGPTSWLDAPVGTSQFYHYNTTGIASIRYEWGNAFP